MRRLKDLTVHEISLVKRAANKRKFLVTKTAGDRMPSPDIEKIRDSLLSVPEPILKAVDAVTKGTFAKDDGSVTLTDDQAARLKAAGRMLQPIIGDLPMEAVSQMLSAIGATGTDALMDSDIAADVDGDQADAAAAVSSATDAADAAATDAADASAAASDAMDASDADQASDIPLKKDDDRMACAQKALQKSREVYAQMMKDAGFDPDEEGDAVPADGASTMMKSDEEDEEGKQMAKTASLTKSAQDATIRKSERDLQVAHAALVAQHKEQVAKSIDLQLKLDKQEMVQKAAELPHLGKPAEMMDILLRSKQKDPEGFDKSFVVMKSWNDAMNKSDIFVEHGSQATGDGVDIEARINAAVQGVVQKSNNMTSEQAYSHFISETPEGRAMYREYMGASSSKKGR